MTKKETYNIPISGLNLTELKLASAMHAYTQWVTECINRAEDPKKISTPNRMAPALSMVSYSIIELIDTVYLHDNYYEYSSVTISEDPYYLHVSTYCSDSTKNLNYIFSIKEFKYALDSYGKPRPDNYLKLMFEYLEQKGKIN